MERKGYSNMFDTMHGKYDPAVENAEDQHVIDLYKKRLKKLPMNIIECIVGIALLVLCYNYIQTHPAEKSSLFTGVDMLTQKVRVYFSQRSDGQGAETQRKYELEKTFEEIISLASQGECLTDDDLDTITLATERLKKMSVEEFVGQEKSFSTVAKVYFDKVREQCVSGSSSDSTK